MLFTLWPGEKTMKNSVKSAVQIFGFGFASTRAMKVAFKKGAFSGVHPYTRKGKGGVQHKAGVVRVKP